MGHRPQLWQDYKPHMVLGSSLCLNVTMVPVAAQATQTSIAPTAVWALDTDMAPAAVENHSIDTVLNGFRSHRLHHGCGCCGVRTQTSPSVKVMVLTIPTTQLAALATTNCPGISSSTTLGHQPTWAQVVAQISTSTFTMEETWTLERDINPDPRYYRTMNPDLMLSSSQGQVVTMAPDGFSGYQDQYDPRDSLTQAYQSGPRGWPRSLVLYGPQ